MDDLTVKTMKLLEANRCKLTRQQFKTLKGQVIAGDIAGAEKGLQKLLARRERRGTTT